MGYVAVSITVESASLLTWHRACLWARQPRRLGRVAVCAASVSSCLSGTASRY